MLYVPFGAPIVQSTEKCGACRVPVLGIVILVLGRYITFRYLNL